MTEQDKIHMWDRFDKIVCIHYLPYKNERFKNIATELKRVGILNNPKFEWEFTVPNVFNDMIRFPKGRIGRFFNVYEKPYAIQYYVMMKRLLMMGYEKVLVLEDDVAFLKDLGEISRILDATPSDWDIMNYSPRRRKGWLGNGKGFWGHYYDLKGNEVKKDWDEDLFVRYQSIVYGTVCNAYTKRAMQRYVENSEKCLLNADGYTWKDTEGLNTYCTSFGTCLAISIPYGKSMGGANAVNEQWRGIDASKYNLT